MDSLELLQASGMSAGTIAILFIAYKVFMTIKGKKFVSDCCGKKGEVGFDVRDMGATPPRIASDNKIPPQVENVRQNHEGDRPQEGDNQSHRGAFELSRERSQSGAVC